MRHSLVSLIIWIVVCLGMGASGSFLTPGEWYAQINKPTWVPPNYIFGPVWTVLYIMMGVAAWLVWKQGGFSGTAPALTFFVIQLVLNAAWTWIFFGLYQPGLAFLEILVLWLAIVITIVAFWRVRPLAAGLLIPYLFWVSFASILNYSIWRLNH